MASSQQRAAAKKVVKAANEVKAARNTEDLEVTSAAQWKRKGRDPVKLALPSGNVCLAKNPGMEVFLLQGMIPNALLPLVQQAVEQGQGLTPTQQAKLNTDPEMLGQVMEFARMCLVECVVEPVVLPVPEGEAQRDPECLYADEVDLEDTIFIMQWVVGGTSDLERFREEQASALATVATEPAVQHETK